MKKTLHPHRDRMPLPKETYDFSAPYCITAFVGFNDCVGNDDHRYIDRRFANRHQQRPSGENVIVLSPIRPVLTRDHGDRQYQSNKKRGSKAHDENAQEVTATPDRAVPPTNNRRRRRPITRADRSI